MLEEHITQLILDLHPQDYRGHERLIDNLGVYADSAVPVFVKLLKEDSEGRVQSIVRALGKVGPLAIPALMPLLDDPIQSISSRALIALTYIGEPAIPALAEALHHPNVDHVAMSAAAMLGSMGEIALPTLIANIDDENVKVREAVALGLSGLGDLAIDVLRQMLDDSSHDVRRHAIETLRRIGTPDALRVLREIRNHP